MQTRTLGIVVAAWVFVACSDAPDPQGRKSSNLGGSGSDPGGATSGAPTGPTCPSGIATPTTIASDPDAADLALAGNALYFRVGTKLVKTNKDGTGRTDVYTSKDLVRVFTDGTTVVAVESPDPPNAALKVTTVADPKNAQDIGTGNDLVAAGMDVFGFDADNAYAIGETDKGDTIYKVAKAGGGMDPVVQTTGVITTPQLASGTLWYVLDSTQIYKVAVDKGTPSLVVTVDGGCSLAVGAAHIFCSTGGAVEQRDLAGANVQKLADAQTSKVPEGFGAGVAAGDALVVRSTGQGPLKDVLRSVGGGNEQVLACGRDTIGAMVVDGTSVAWIEPGKGVFIAPR
jgi:hypothetical protein